MRLTDFLNDTDLDDSLLIGYYGGGNYGDELLLEVLGNLLQRKGADNVTVTYQRPETYRDMHHDFGFNLINIYDREAVLKTAFKSKRIVIGGGGLWGVDMNTNTLLLSIFLFVSRWALRKKIYLLGVGYYNSTNRMGRWAAWFAGKAANVILARDDESAANFGRVSKHVHQDADIAWTIQKLNLTPYRKEVKDMQKELLIGDKTLVAALRRPQSKSQARDFTRYNQLVAELVKINPNRPTIIVMLESEIKDRAVYKQARALRRRHKHLRIIEPPYNPLAMFLYIKRNSKKLSLIAPQLHLIMTAHLTGVPFLPITYDNKVSMLLDQIGVPAKEQLALASVSLEHMQKFADDFFGGKM